MCLPRRLDGKSETIDDIVDDLLSTKNLQLYIALYAVDEVLHQNGPIGPQEYCWTIIVAPGNVPKEQYGLRYRLKEKEKASNLAHNPDRKVELGVVKWIHHGGIAARVLIAEVAEVKAMEEHIQSVWPEQTMSVLRSGTECTSQEWVQRVVQGLGGLVPGSLSGTRYFLATKLAA